MSKYFVLAPALAAVLSVSANAQEQTVAVPFGDLDLTSDAAVTRFDQRIDAAVELVCGNPREHKPLPTKLAMRKCGREAWSDVESARQIAIDRARGRQPSVEFASAPTSAIQVRRR